MALSSLAVRTSNQTGLLSATLNVSEFNYTVTYSKHSDVYIPYGECVKLTPTNPGLVKQGIADLVRKKRNLAAWMVSHCSTGSQRERYVRKLSQHMDIDIYGACGNLYCTNDDSCRRIMSKYKFYLAFENSLCGEYITEKLWRSFEWGLVPVVFGGLDTYKSILPPKSYIDVADFSSPDLLAKYLKKLDSDISEYQRFFDWQYTHQCYLLNPTHKMGRICTFLLKRQHCMVDLTTVWNHHSTRCAQGNASRYLAKLGVK